MVAHCNDLIFDNFINVYPSVHEKQITKKVKKKKTKISVLLNSLTEKMVGHSLTWIPLTLNFI